jgi:hypothetical protein
VISLICSWSSSSMRVARLVVRSRQVGVAGVARTERVCFGPGAIRWPGVQASSGLDCRREPQRSAIASQLTSPTRWRIMFRALHDPRAFSSLYRGRAQGRGLEPRAFNRLGRVHRAGGVTPVEVHTDPAVKTGNPCLTPRGASRAVGGIPARAENPGRRASSCPTVLLSRALCEPDLKSLLELVRERASADSSRAAGPVSHGACSPRSH